ncbi:MAG TPA: HAD family hydrolase [Gemmatimonadales bacterium]|jgi:D-glycero-D-manno-heptose 1,7-bisphosphate phosphatase|nr:HAD family hydrolase [Gemmatimonadales bacterium]
MGIRTTSRTAVFLDRDGILNELVERDGRPVSPRFPEDFRIRCGAADAVHALRQAGIPVFVITNQPDVARGHLTAAALESMSTMLRAAVPIDDLAVCPHDDADGCGCRKPKPGMLVELAKRWDVDLEGSYMVGDSWRDVEAGRAAGCRTILVSGAAPAESAPDLVVSDLWAAVLAITERHAGAPEPE